jgi:ubiquitin-like domain-containing CTD phosphatase 1
MYPSINSHPFPPPRSGFNMSPTEKIFKKFTANTSVYIMNEPRENKPLLVLDLDHTLLDFSSKTLQRDTGSTGAAANAMKRPHMDSFLTIAYQHYDLVVWSQTSWRWLETKLTELRMLTHSGYKFCFVLDKTSMFSIVSTKRDGTSHQHQVKPLQLIWSKYPRWDRITLSISMIYREILRSICRLV